MVDNCFLWDSSTETIFSSSQGKDIYSLVQQVDKKSFMSDFPPLFLSVFKDVDIKNKPIFIGVGPGSFTGIKSGVSFIGGWLFSKEKQIVNTVSSTDILSCYVPAVSGLLLVVVPFNRKEWFVSLYRFEKGDYVTLKKDIHLKTAEDFEQFRQKVAGEELSVASPDSIKSEQFLQDAEISAGRIALMSSIPFRSPSKNSIIKQINIETSPLFLNYILQPAGLSNSTDFYIQTIKEERTMTDQMDTNKRIEELKKKHKSLHDDVDKLEKNVYMTPHDKRDLKMLQKKKLKLKDEIALLEQQ